ncbi:SDR family NAD(P)-dependent oxidoreductase [Azospirillum rugosum]|uniref:NAD(P)-dependent dehydrogenase (Short-subunit alcohol dehydrogenase family) n=1 Tax=Azospirillum rugosum TaxID=416170 RepID=A0ABS4SG24_9PROT|nr:SDR family oxidoreductase [Azospirillum rugosum]MBP2291501.1 NAD(P)-dependent dehydrogenase (short-subunit alcohol dehydrogenase family) [Azospirillum rugosum]MDQ0525289.1 NAD(P)-dependent dehydrogenase (short-subunit alcohol dehydrogenase family) [Azospirillum rugosum]
MDSNARYPSLKDRAVLVTGGGTGIGAAIVERFCAQGSRVAFLDIAEEPSRALVEQLGDATPLFLPCDLRDIAALRASIQQAADALGPFHVLVNNAASDDRHPWQDVTPDYWDDRMAVNLRHQFFAAQAVAPAMQAAGGGSIVNLGSISWVIGQGGMAAYSAAKSAVLGLTRSLARDLGPSNVRVNCVMPGAVMTERQLRLWITEDDKRTILDHQCLKRLLEPDDIARMVLFLAADDSAMCTSQSFIVDGGWV